MPEGCGTLSIARWARLPHRGIPSTALRGGRVAGGAHADLRADLDGMGEFRKIKDRSGDGVIPDRMRRRATTGTWKRHVRSRPPRVGVPWTNRGVACSAGKGSGCQPSGVDG